MTGSESARSAESVPTRLYVIEVARFPHGDVSGYLMDANGEVLHSHMSSSLSWLVSDLTQNFGRGADLAVRYPGHEVVVVSGNDPLPPEIERHFERSNPPGEEAGTPSPCED